jgi:tetratricopeptide (TPR) repeat protein
MDPTTLLTAMLVAIGLLGADVVLNSDSVIVDVAPPPKISGLSIDTDTLQIAFQKRLNEIARTVSLVRPIEIRPGTEEGVGMALAGVVKLRGVALALEQSIGKKSDRLRLALFIEDGQTRALVSGSGHLTKDFSTVLTMNKDEPLLRFVQRCSLWGVSQLAPYSTTLYLLQQHAADKDFTDVIALAEHTKSQLPPTPHSSDRALFDNVLGLVALFKNDKQGAREAFDAAMHSDPTNPVPFLNAAFTDMQLDEDQRAVDRMEQLIRLAPPANKTLLATAYMTEGAALMGVKDLPRANQMFAQASEIDPRNSAVLGLWSEAKALQGDQTESARLLGLAMADAATFENYSEVAALYFHLAWAENQPVTRSTFTNPAIVTFH